MANGDSGHPYLDTVVDAAVAAGSAFFATLSGLIYQSSATQTPLNYEVAVIAGLGAAGGAFFFSINAARKRSRRPRARRR